ncbi:MAG: hypothetical protein RMJ98_09795 [Myxococcales bacterium]|nr:hypothetical protein [Polyangiaceae bacterium]MDW8249581.1 hypothetical protein [Myxococcales bacterium]
MSVPRWLLRLLLISWCTPLHSTRNAPGHVDLKPPEDPEQHPGKEPEDPGETMLRIATGPTGGIVLPSRSSDGQTRGTFGAEFSTYYHRKPYSSAYDRRDGYLGNGDRYDGMNLGALALWRKDKVGARFYGEVQHSELGGFLGFAAGWQVNTLGQHDPQITLSLGPMYARSSTDLGHGTDVEIGAVLKYPWTIWLGSR